MRDLTPTEFLAQLEEAYARAAVALTRAQRLCILMAPLDMKGLLGAATVIGCLKYGAGVCGFDPEHRDVKMYLREPTVEAGPDDAAFLASLRRSITNPRGVYPPVAFAEVYCNDSCSLTKVRRLHLIVVDLERAKSVGSNVYWQFQKMNVSARYEECFNTLPVPMTDSDCPLRCRYVYGYGVDGSDRPSYLLWPRRGSDGHFWLMEPRTGDYFDPAKANFIAPLGVEHFFDAFALEQKRDIREDAAIALELDSDAIQPNLVVKQAVARQFQLTPGTVPDDPPAKRAKKTTEQVSPSHDTTGATGDVKMERESSPESSSDSSDSNSDFSSEDGSSDVSDLDKFEEAYEEFGKLTAGVDPKVLERHMAGHTSDDVPGLSLAGGLATLRSLANVPKTWPLARLTIPLSGFSKHLERLLEGYCLEVYATNIYPDEQLGSIKAYAKDLVLLLAFYKQALFALGSEVKGTAYLRRAGETLRVLIEDEKRGSFKLPPKFGDNAPSDSLPARWSAFGIPMVLLIGLALGRVATDEGAKIPLFKSLLHLLRDVDLDLPLEETVAKIVKQCAMMSVAASNFVTRVDIGGSQDLHAVKPILDKLATMSGLDDIAAGTQNLSDDLIAKNISGTLRSLIWTTESEHPREIS